ncbi:MAG: diguanylate cyclase [Betaproteobacteria bacterium]|nr:diguanylate cyclase [Betaproteobacteria bacterium]
MSETAEITTLPPGKLSRLLRTWTASDDLPVLVVDDTASVRELLCAHLRQIAGFSPEAASSLKELRELIERNPRRFFCAALDLKLPDAPNGEVVDEVLACGIPVIVLTASMDDKLRSEMQMRPIVDYVVKRNNNEIEHVAYIIGRLRENQTTKIIIADDSPSFCSYLEMLLKRYSYKTLIARSGPEALKHLDENPDTTLIITDVHMAGMDGFELVANVRRRYRREDLAIIGVSGMANSGLSARLMKLGANDLLAKPFEADEFYCRITQATNMVGYVRQIRHFATRDFLTGVFNRRQFFDLGENLHANARCGNVQIATAVIDADHFKRINDTHGHHVGDQALKAIANALVQCLRKTDVVARYGGEEFVCMAVMKSANDAPIVFERIRHAIEELDLRAGPQQVPITVSVGVTVNLCESLDAMIKRADVGVYEAKRAGRNRVVYV